MKVQIEFDVLSDVCARAGIRYTCALTVKNKCRNQGLTNFCVAATCPLLERGGEEEDSED
jgi:hypothetical protein